MKRLWMALGFAVLLGAGAAAWYGYGGGQSPAPQRPAARGPGGGPAVPVVVAQVVQKAMPVQVEAIGTVQTMASVIVRARVDSQIDKVLFKEGDFVKAGDILFQFDKRSIEAQIRQSEAQVAKSRAQLANSRRDVERYQALLARDYASQQKADAVKTDSMALEATNRADEAALENLRVLLSYFTVRAPISGRTGSVTLKEGNVVKGNDTATASQLVTINQMDPIYVTFALPQQFLGEIRDARRAGPVKVAATLPSSGDRREGEVTFVDNTIDVSSGTVTVKATFENDDEKLWPGQFVNVATILRVEADALAIPSQAVQIGQNGNYVFVVKPDRTAEFRPIKIGRVAGSESIIAEGLKPGEQVVVDGQLRLTNGTRTDPRPLGGAPAIAGAGG